jgi:hypothetical protein
MNETGQRSQVEATAQAKALISKFADTTRSPAPRDITEGLAVLAQLCSYESTEDTSKSLEDALKKCIQEQFDDYALKYQNDLVQLCAPEYGAFANAHFAASLRERELVNIDLLIVEAEGIVESNTPNKWHKALDRIMYNWGGGDKDFISDLGHSKLLEYVDKISTTHREEKEKAEKAAARKERIRSVSAKIVSWAIVPLAILVLFVNSTALGATINVAGVTVVAMYIAFLVIWLGIFIYKFIYNIIADLEIVGGKGFYVVIGSIIALIVLIVVVMRNVDNWGRKIEMLSQPLIFSYGLLGVTYLGIKFYLSRKGRDCGNFSYYFLRVVPITTVTFLVMFLSYKNPSVSGQYYIDVTNIYVVIGYMIVQALASTMSAAEQVAFAAELQAYTADIQPYLLFLAIHAFCVICVWIALSVDIILNNWLDGEGLFGREAKPIILGIIYSLIAVATIVLFALLAIYCLRLYSSGM